MPDKVLEGCQGQNDAPRRGVLAADGPQRNSLRHTFLREGIRGESRLAI